MLYGITYANLKKTLFTTGKIEKHLDIFRILRRHVVSLITILVVESPRSRVHIKTDNDIVFTTTIKKIRDCTSRKGSRNIVTFKVFEFKIINFKFMYK